MSNAIEIEAKALVSQDDYRKLSKLFPSSPRYTQTNYYIDSDDRILNKEGIALLDIDIESLKILTSLTTDRIDVEYEGGLLSIDRNTYSGKTDYEIEFEYNNLGGAENILSTLFHKNGIKAPFSKASKTRRAMEALGK